MPRQINPIEAVEGVPEAHRSGVSAEPAPAERLGPRTPASAILALQRTAGNQAVSAALAARAPSGPAMLLRDFTGDGKHQPDDVAYATDLGKADAARLRKIGTLSPEDRKDINSKLSWFQGAARAAYGQQMQPALAEVIAADSAPEPFTDAQLERMGQATQVNVLFNDIEKLKNDRIQSWRETANAKEPKPLRWVLDTVVSMTALGMGGVFGLLISRGMKGEFLKDFVYLANLELGYKVVEDGYAFAMRETGEALRKGALQATDKRAKNVEAALAGDQDDLLGVYAEAMRLQARSETAEQQSQFNLNASTTYRRSAVLMKRMALQIIYDQLFSEPQVFHRELTAGFLRLMDENTVAETAKEDYGGDRERAWKEDTDLHEVEMRKGNLLVLPVGTGYLGDWGSARVGFGQFRALATEVNTKTLMKLAGTPVKDLPLSLGFRFWAENPLYRIVYGGDLVKVWFTRDPSGHIYLDDDLGEGAMEWLGSYYTGISRELSDSEREKFAPLGAQKLYEATKDKPIAKLENFDIL